MHVEALCGRRLVTLGITLLNKSSEADSFRTKKGKYLTHLKMAM
jgi:hypothetical protein